MILPRFGKLYKNYNLFQGIFIDKFAYQRCFIFHQISTLYTEHHHNHNFFRYVDALRPLKNIKRRLDKLWMVVSHFISIRVHHIPFILLELYLHSVFITLFNSDKLSELPKVRVSKGLLQGFIDEFWSIGIVRSFTVNYA